MNTTGISLGARIAPLALLAGLTLAACTGSGSAPVSPSPAMVEHSPSPSPAMVEHSPSPSPAMVEHSPSPSPAMVEHSPSPSAALASPSAPVSMGTFHGVDGSASGTAALFHQADGSFVVTFESFSISSATGAHVVLVPNKDVATDGDINKTTIVDLGPLTGTTGMQDYKVPASADAMTYHTVVLWDTGMAHAIAAAPLR
jgi:hypothetical protein